MTARKDKTPAAAESPTVAKRPPIAWCDAICRRFLKPGQNIYWAREMPCFTKLWQAYPHQRFWEVYELPFSTGLNHISWFESVEGAEDLKRAWLLFNYTPPAPEVVAPQAADAIGVDGAPQLPYTVPTPARPRTVAGFLSKT